MIKILKNPFYIYTVSFLLVFFVYSFGWSTLFPSLSITLILFFFTTFLVSFCIGFIVDKAKLIRFSKINEEKSRYRRFVILIFIGYLIEFVYFREIPLLNVIRGAEGTVYSEFGIKVFHVVLVTFNSFYLVYLFHLYLSKPTKKILFYYVLCYIPPLLVVNRGMIIIGVLTCFFVFVLSMKKAISLNKSIFLVFMALAILYIFGFIGNFRSGGGDSEYIPKESNVTDEFLESDIPNEYYWTYLYLGSPLATFQYNVNYTKEVDYNVFSLVTMECLPDIVSKRIASIFGIEKRGQFQLRRWLTVGTIYSKSYSYAKWLGPVIMFLFSILAILFLLVLVPKSSKYHVTAIAIISTLTFLNTFDNMFSFSGISLQLFYAVLFSLLEGKRLVMGSLAENPI